MRAIALTLAMAIGMSAQADWLVSKRAHYFEDADLWVSGFARR